jgi:membrane protease YdiL (CAAX protease family)
VIPATSVVESPRWQGDDIKDVRKWISPTVIFCTFTFALTWFLWRASMITGERLILNINVLYLQIHDPVKDALVIAGSVVPGFVALILGLFTRWKYFPNPLRRIRPKSRVGILLPVAFLAPILIVLTSFVLQYDLTANSFANLRLVDLIRIFLINLPLAPFWEECGWRGCLLPVLSSRFGLGRASLLVGLIWASWHIPLYFGIHHSSLQWYLTWFIGIVGMSVVLAVFYSLSGNSILLTIIFHGVWNATSTWLFETNPKFGLAQLAFISGAFWDFAGLMWLWKVSTDKEKQSVV